MNELIDARFELRDVAAREWLILDHKYEANDPRRTVGCVYEVDEHEVEVMWMRTLTVATRYMSPVEALDDVRRLYERGRATRPIDIPHLPPLLSTSPDVSALTEVGGRRAQGALARMPQADALSTHPRI
ncbi:hypothetical protein [Microbacterium sp. EST19A]|uniref:hypothetical protein n=1 Tax=Microbacterium sp. EST19A TaxID=2862681 RepID=UPI001CBCC337|nr:hypothetical protein [Microbacterium sp. EST19A]